MPVACCFSDGPVQAQRPKRGSKFKRTGWDDQAKGVKGSKGRGNSSSSCHPRQPSEYEGQGCTSSYLGGPGGGSETRLDFDYFDLRRSGAVFGPGRQNRTDSVISLFRTCSAIVQRIDISTDCRFISAVLPDIVVVFISLIE